MSNLTTTRHACGIGKGDVILINPWTLLPGRWTVRGVSVVSEDYTAIHVDDCDLEWVLPDTLDVEITAREAMQRAHNVLGVLLGDDYDEQPLIGWSIDHETGRLNADLYSVENPEPALRSWAKTLDTEVTETERDGSRSLVATATLDGVTIRLRTTVYTPAAVAR